MTSRGKLLLLLVVATALGVGTTLISVEFVARSPVASNPAAPANFATAQEKAEQQHEKQTITSDCAALRNMGVADKDCEAEKRER